VFDGAGTVRVFDEYDYLVVKLNASRDAEQIRRLLKAPNAEAVRKHGGKLVGIRLLSFGNDSGDPGERHGRSTVTTERIRNDAGGLIGSKHNLKHKAENVEHALPLLAWAAETSLRGQLHAPNPPK
jgi:hypothetical protein